MKTRFLKRYSFVKRWNKKRCEGIIFIMTEKHVNTAQERKGPLKRNNDSTAVLIKAKTQNLFRKTKGFQCVQIQILLKCCLAFNSIFIVTKYICSKA